MSTYKLTALKVLMVVAGLAYCDAANALDLQSAKQQGKVCEGSDGFLQARDPGAQSLVNEVNDKRRGEYQRIAEQNKITPDAAATLAANKLGGEHRCG